MVAWSAAKFETEICLLVLQDALEEEYAAQPFCITNHGSTLAVTSQWIEQLQVCYLIALAVQGEPMSALVPMSL